MKIAFLLLLVVGAVTANFCYNDIRNECTGLDTQSSSGDYPNCNAIYSGVHHVKNDLFKYALQHINHSFQYLLMSTNFANYKNNREGFSKLYRKMSDKTWEDAIDIVKYVSKRGHAMDFAAVVNEDPNLAWTKGYEMHELLSLSRALDMAKSLATDAHKIHSEATKRSNDYHDAETISFMEEKFVHKHSDIIRDLAGYANDVADMYRASAGDSSLSIFLFDEYLKNSI